MTERNQKPTVEIGLIGSGFMGKCHANAFGAVAGIFDLPVVPRKMILADVDQATADAAANALGFDRGTDDWRALIHSDDVDIVAITAPNVFHEPMALEAIAAGKTVYCEKPLSTTVQSAQRMADAADAAGVVTSVGFNFQRNPMVTLAKQLIAAGEIGRVTGFRGRHAENYMADPMAPHSFRTDPQGGGALADIGSHIVSMASYLLGPIANVQAICTTLFNNRPISQNSTEMAPVLVDDMTHALVEFENGTVGSLEANWAATGRTMDLSFEITGTKGAIYFTQERMNELCIYSSGAGGAGYRRIEAGPEHSPYGAFCPAPGHHLGFNDLKLIEVAELLQAHHGQTKCTPDFRGALYVQQVIEAMQTASKTQRWVSVPS